MKPDSGAPGYDGVQAPDTADPFYYRPDHDAPAHPGALARAQRPFRAAGLDAPWYALVGNHDVLAQGEVPVTPEIDAFAAGDRLVPSLDPEIVDIPRDEAWRRGRRRRPARRSSRSTRSRSPPTRERRLVAPGEAEQRLGERSTVDLGPDVRAILVDTVNREGTSQAASRRRRSRRCARSSSTRGPLGRGLLAQPADPRRRSRVLDQHPRVVAAISGNSHRNRDRAARPLLADQHLVARRLPPAVAHVPAARDARGVALETWMVDHDGRGLAGVSRELAFLDAQGGRPQRFAGTRADRNHGSSFGAVSATPPPRSVFSRSRKRRVP